MGADETEIWRPVVGWEGRYEVSNMGRVRSTSAVRGGGKILALNSMHKGYPRISFTDGKRRETYQIHRLVLLAFVGPPPLGHEAAHLNGVRDDARLSNLRWVTRKENAGHKNAHGTMQRGDTHSTSILTTEAVRYIRGNLNTKSYAEMGRELGVSEATVANAAKGHKWRHVFCPECDRLSKELEAERAKTAALAGRVEELEEAILTHSECVAVCERCGHETPSDTDDVCLALTHPCAALQSPTEAPKDPNGCKCCSDGPFVCDVHKRGRTGAPTAPREALTFSGAEGDELLTCAKCGPQPHRFRPAPDAGPFWRCSLCGEVWPGDRASLGAPTADGQPHSIECSAAQTVMRAPTDLPTGKETPQTAGNVPSGKAEEYLRHAEETLGEMRRKLDAYGIGDRPSSPPVKLLWLERRQSEMVESLRAQLRATPTESTPSTVKGPTNSGTNSESTPREKAVEMLRAMPKFPDSIMAARSESKATRSAAEQKCPQCRSRRWAHHGVFEGMIQCTDCAAEYYPDFGDEGTTPTSEECDE